MSRGKQTRTCQLPGCTDVFTIFLSALRDGRGKYCCRKCFNVSMRRSAQFTCAYCGKEFERARSRKKHSKSGLFFCCPEHKRLAQAVKHGLQALWPSHYNTGQPCYRKIALEHYSHVCVFCGYKDEPRILEVHHKDGDRSNNAVENLALVCPNCHTKYHKGLL